MRRHLRDRHFQSTSPRTSPSSPPRTHRRATAGLRRPQADSYAVSVDTRGKLRWAKGSLGDDHLICVLSEQAPADYLDLLREKGVSYVVYGESAVDLAQAVDLLGEHFGIRPLLLEGGGHINGAFLETGLVDEVSLLLVPGIDGRCEAPAVFHGVNPLNQEGLFQDLGQKREMVLYYDDCVHPRVSFGECSVGLWSERGDSTEIAAPGNLFALNSVLAKPVAVLAVGDQSDLTWLATSVEPPLRGWRF